MIKMNERVKQIRKAYGLTQKEFAEALGVTNVAISKIESGQRGLTGQMIRSICREFGVNEQWLLASNGDSKSQAPCGGDGMNERVKQIRRSYGMTQQEFADALGVTGATVSRIESGQRSLTSQMIKAICREFDIKEHWLLTGEGDDEPRISRRVELSRWVDQVLQNGPESWQYQLLNALETLTREDCEAIVRLAGKIAEAKQKAGE